jgi:hypothetical protein
MSSHLRHCPKHRKPLPCSHCVLTAKPVPVVPEIVAEPTVPPITIIPPRKADAKPAPRSAISPDIRKTIEESLASKPNVISNSRRTVEADTSEGTKTIKLKETDNVDSAVDDAVEEIVRNPKKTSDKLLKPASNQQPAYLKSVTHVLVRNPANKEAPYGRDENDRPILPGRSDQTIATELLSKEFLKAGSCSHKSNPKYCLLCGTTNFKTAPPEPVDLEDQLRRLLGITTDVATRPSQPKKNFSYFPEILKITRGQLIGLLELTVGIEPRAIRKKFLKSRSIIDSRIAELERAAARIIELKKLLAESGDAWSVHRMKLEVKRGERQPEDIPDKKTREQFKREAKKNTEKREQEKSDLQKLLRESDIEQLKQRAANWGSNPNDFDTMAATEDVTVKFGEKFTFGHEDEDLVPERTLEGYLALLDGNDILKDVSRRLHQFPTLDSWRYFENEIVLQAIGFRLVRPTKQAFAEYPQLRKYLNGAVADPDQDDPENKLILKTGGAEIGGSIHSGGHRNGHKRPLESFDKRKPSRPGESQEYGGERPDNFYSGMDSGDLEERGGDE